MKKAGFSGDLVWIPILVPDIVSVSDVQLTAVEMRTFTRWNIVEFEMKPCTNTRPTYIWINTKHCLNFSSKQKVDQSERKIQRREENIELLSPANIPSL